MSMAFLALGSKIKHPLNLKKNIDMTKTCGLPKLAPLKWVSTKGRETIEDREGEGSVSHRNV